MDFGVLQESPHGSQSSSRIGACRWALLLSSGCSVALPFAGNKGSVAFPRGFPTRVSHRSVTHANMLCVDTGHDSRGSVGKQVSLEWTESSGGLWEWWHDPGVPLIFPVNIESSRAKTRTRESFPNEAEKRTLISSGGVGNGAPLVFDGTLSVPLEWRRVCQGTS